MPQSQIVEQLLEALTVLCNVDAVRRGANNGNTSPLEIQRKLAAPWGGGKARRKAIADNAADMRLDAEISRYFLPQGEPLKKATAWCKALMRRP